MSSEPRITAVLPAHNEAAHIGAVISSIPSWVQRIIVVDDCSTDATADVVGELDDLRVHVIRHERNTGVGGAMKTGYREAVAGGADIVAKLDADGQMRPDELERLVEPLILGLADYCKGNRFYFRGAVASMPGYRNFGNTLLSLLTKAASGYWHVYDSQCGFTVVRAAFLQLIDLDALADDYFFENSMLIEMNLLNARVVDVPVTTIYGSETSGVNLGRVVLSFPPRLVAGGARRFWRKHLVTDFDATTILVLAGLILTAFGLGFGAFHWYRSVATGVIASTGTVMIAVLPLIIGIQLVIQAFSIAVQASPGARETAQYVRTLVERGTEMVRRPV